MGHISKLVAAALTFGLSVSSLAAPSDYQSHTTSDRGEAKSILLAQKKRSKNAGPAKGVREKHITREARQTSKDQSKIDFEAVDIGGQRKTPMGTLINQNKADKNYDFVRIRQRWHPEMVQSAQALEAGSQ